MIFIKPKPIDLLLLFRVIFLELTLGKIDPYLPTLPEVSFCKVTSSPKNSSKRKTIFFRFFMFPSEEANPKVFFYLVLEEFID